jgi:hypothetical protein
MRKMKITRTTQWMNSYLEMTEKFNIESALVKKCSNRQLSASKLISKQLQENMEMVSGQNFLLLKN